MLEIRAAQLAYYCYGNNKKLIKEMGFEDVKTISSDSEFCYMGKSGDELFIAIRGTDDIQDVWEDLKFISKKSKYKETKGRRIHTGFLQSAMQIIRQINKELKYYLDKYDISRFVLIGHSKGGAMAVSLATMLENKFNEHIVHIYTYGAPRVFKKGYEKLPDTYHHFRYVNGKDPVPRLPREYMSYVHDCKSINFKDGWFSWLWIGDFKDHSMLRYLHQIARKS